MKFFTGVAITIILSSLLGCKGEDKKTENNSVVVPNKSTTITQGNPNSNLDSLETANGDAANNLPKEITLAEDRMQHLRESDNYKAAISIADSMLRVNPNDIRTWGIKATLQYESGDTLASIQS